MYSLRKAVIKDLGFITKVDLDDEGIFTGNPRAKESADTLKAHGIKMRKFIKRQPDDGDSEWDTCQKFAYIAVDKATNRKIGLIMFLFRDMNQPSFQHFGIYDKFDRELFPANGKVCEIFQLWVAPRYRRQGIATALKKKAEEIAVRNHIPMIYTHTEAINKHIVELNEKLGYSQIRTGPLWDEITRTSLIKHLDKKDIKTR